MFEQLKKESVMHLCFFKENKKNNKVLHIGKVKRICVLQKQKIVVHSIQNNMEKIVIYNLNGEVCKIVFCENIFKINKIKFEFLDNYILVKDFNEGILLKKDLSEIIKNN